MEIAGKKAVVVGGASGMARATAELLAKRGALVAILDLPSSSGDTVASSLGDGASFHSCDVTDADETEAALADAVGSLGGLQVAVNTAGGGIARKTLSRSGPHPLDEFRRVVELNLVATFNLNRLQAMYMADNQPDDGERGVIVNTSSIAAFEGQIGQVAYAAAKAGIAGMTLTMARDLGIVRDPGRCHRPQPVPDRHHRRHPRRLCRQAHGRRRLPQEDGPPGRVRPAGGGHRREPHVERRYHPSRRWPALRSEVTAPEHSP